MKLLLCAVNAKYIHSNLAVYSLKAYSEAVGAGKEWEVKLKEYTINHYQDDILQDIYQEKADVVVFSCYIWNMNMIYDICEDLKLASPGTEIWLGGPEVSYDSEKVLKEHPEIALVMNGEGEKTFAQLLSGKEKRQIAGITYREPLESRNHGIPECRAAVLRVSCMLVSPWELSKRRNQATKVPALSPNPRYSD